MIWQVYTLWSTQMWLPFVTTKHYYGTIDYSLYLSCHSPFIFFHLFWPICQEVLVIMSLWSLWTGHSPQSTMSLGLEQALAICTIPIVFLQLAPCLQFLLYRPDGKQLRVCGHPVFVKTTQICHCNIKAERQHVNTWVQLCSNKILIIDIKILILYSFNVQNIIIFI